MDQVVEYLFNKHEALSSNLVLPKTKTKTTAGWPPTV
jgi:hypothetical protein